MAAITFGAACGDGNADVLKARIPGVNDALLRARAEMACSQWADCCGPPLDECVLEAVAGFESLVLEAAAEGLTVSAECPLATELEVRTCSSVVAEPPGDCGACKPFHGEGRLDDRCVSFLLFGSGNGYADTCAQGFTCSARQDGTFGVCVDPCHRIGGPCDGPDGCAGQGWCGPGDTCEAYALIGDPCPDPSARCDPAISDCVEDSDGALRCAALPGLGESCALRKCTSGTRCDFVDVEEDTIPLCVEDQPAVCKTYFHGAGV